MRIPLNWLKEYIDIKIAPEKLADKFTMSGTEVEILKSGLDIDDKVVVGEVLEVKKHPNADRLSIAKVRVSNSKQKTANSKLQIVCGGTNLEVGQKVPVATIGAVIGDFDIKEAELRGAKSHGMICSESELGISDDATGEIMVLGADAKIGAKVKDIIGKGETILEAEITPNRGDCLSMIGIARDLSAVLKTPVKLPKVKFVETKQKASDYVKVEVKNPELCSRYMLRVIKIEKNGQAPKWMKERLESAGMRSLSALVDITNYVMLEYGQPLHAFDYDKIRDSGKTKKFIVRRGNEGEKLKTLDGIERVLTKNDIVISDSKGPIATPVMGGENSGSDEKTKIIILESATFDKTSVRKTAQRLALRSESSNRFEKGIPMHLNEIAIDMAAELIQKICGGEILKGRVDIQRKGASDLWVDLRTSRIESFIGEKISMSEATGILKRLGFETSTKNDTIKVKVPWWRLDVSIEEDLLEEIARIYGYDHIPSTLPGGKLPGTFENEKLKGIEKTRDVLCKLGFSEVYNYSFVSEKDLSNIGIDKKDALRIGNPISNEHEYMRPTLFPSILRNVSKNQNNSEELKIFEAANIYIPNGKNLPTEKIKVAGALYGGEYGGIKYKEGKDFYALKGAIGVLLKGMGAYNFKVELKNIEDKKYETGTGADISVQGKSVCRFGEITKEVRNYFDIKKRCIVFEIDLDVLLSFADKQTYFVPIPKYPSIKRDLSFVVDKAISVQKLVEIAGLSEAKHMQNIKVSDVYYGKELGENKKSITISLEFLSDERTLEDKEADVESTKIVQKIKQKLKGEIRDV